MTNIKLHNKNNFSIANKYFEYINYNRNYSDNTYSHYQNIVTEFLIFIDPLNISQISKEDFENFFKTQKQDLKISSKNNYIVAIKNFLQYCQENLHFDFNFLTKIKTLRNTYDIKVPFSLNEIKLIFSCLEEDEVSFIIKLLYYTGLRVSEAVNILKEDVDLNNNIIKITGKGNKQRFVFIPNNMLDEIKQRLFINKHFLIEIKSKPLRRQKVNTMLNDFAFKRGFNFKIHPHKFRRSLATHLIEMDMNIREIQVYLGHDSILSTEKYIKLSKEKLKSKVMDAFNK